MYLQKEHKPSHFEDVRPGVDPPTGNKLVLTDLGQLYVDKYLHCSRLELEVILVLCRLYTDKYKHSLKDQHYQDTKEVVRPPAEDQRESATPNPEVCDPPTFQQDDVAEMAAPNGDSLANVNTYKMDEGPKYQGDITKTIDDVAKADDAQKGANTYKMVQVPKYQGDIPETIDDDAQNNKETDKMEQVTKYCHDIPMSVDADVQSNINTDLGTKMAVHVNAQSAHSTDDFVPRGDEKPGSWRSAGGWGALKLGLVLAGSLAVGAFALKKYFR